LILLGYAEMPIVEFRESLKQARVQVQLRLIKQNDGVPRSRVAQPEIAVEDLLLARA